MRMRIAASTRRRGPALEGALRVVAVSGAEEEGERAADDDDRREPVELAVECEADQLDAIGEGVELRQPGEPGRAAFLEPPYRIERRREKEHREDDEIHRAGEI